MSATESSRSKQLMRRSLFGESQGPMFRGVAYLEDAGGGEISSCSCSCPLRAILNPCHIIDLVGRDIRGQ